MTHSPRQAKQLMEYITVSQEKEYTENATEYKNMPEFWKPYLADPVAELEELGPEQARSFVRSLADEEKGWTEDIPPQYFVVSWENMRLAYWISYYGTWDLVTGKASPGKIQRVRGNVRFDLQNGALKMAKRQVSLSGMDVLEQRGNRHFDWPNGTGVYAVLNRVTQELYLMDATIYKSMMVQMLVRDPERFDEHFELKVDRGPWARAYVVKQ
jgi:dolichyl-diphosphooligosaccharide--protein glycosyltransferase